MTRWGLGAALAVLLTLALAVSASAARLDAYSVKLGGAKQLRVLKEQGFDITEGQRARSLEIVGTRGQIAKLRRSASGPSGCSTGADAGASRVAAAQASDGWQVWRPLRPHGRPRVGCGGQPTANITTQPWTNPGSPPLSIRHPPWALRQSRAGRSAHFACSEAGRGASLISAFTRKVREPSARGSGPLPGLTAEAADGHKSASAPPEGCGAAPYGRRATG